MIGHVVPASGISYSEKHSVEADGSISERFANPLEIPEDLFPIPDERPGVLQASHPLARYVHVRCYAGEGQDFGMPSGIFFADAKSGIVARIPDFGARSQDAHGAYAVESKQYPAVEITYDEDAIEEENRRRLAKAQQIVAWYSDVVEKHRERYEEKHAAQMAAQAQQDLGNLPDDSPYVRGEEERGDEASDD